MKKSLFLVVSVILVLIFSSSAAYSKGNTGALTSPPPVEFQLYGVFDPDHKYLDDGANTISSSSAGEVRYSGTTYASQIVDSIGVSLTLQRWTGGTWETVGNGSGSSGSDKSWFSHASGQKVTGGYYYRIKSVHWVNENGTYEQGVRYSSSLLVK
ncbi:DUF6147 family protein [Paenibacillus alkalitolerans]|uniref:DUF6147 family protein n=1 Tax=Paenibacillus alkalitolerans TaxID=2799335 RepID=UPI0018F7B711|nr:DUF6147 family protein [Paenibacillus alkalitolerans]